MTTPLDLPGLYLREAHHAVSFASYVDALVLTAGVAQTVTVPAWARFVLFSRENPIYVRRNATATVPSVSVLDGTASEMDPDFRAVSGGDTLSIVSAYVGKVTLAFYA